MVDTVFQNLLKQSNAKIVADQKNSMDWLRKQALQVKNVDTKSIIQTKEPFKRIMKLSETSIGKMYLFTYDPKLKTKLPYYDVYPLIFPIQYYQDSFLGINLHYLPPMARARLMDNLYGLINNNKQDKTTKLRITYQILNSSAKYELFKPCVKKYLFTHVRSNFLYIAPDEWNIALMLPMQKFVKSNIRESISPVSSTAVYKDSLRQAHV